jgi:succinoglycan biosynthesis protein ExoL
VASEGKDVAAEQGRAARGTHEIALGQLDALLEPGPSVDPAAKAVKGKPLVAYFGPDLADSTVRRRAAQWRHAGFRVLTFAFSRNTDTDASSAPADFVNLGRIVQASFARRVVPMAVAALRILAGRQALTEVDLFIARNLDNLLLALFARWVVASPAPLIYEVLDINRSCTASGPRGALLRQIERRALAHIDLLGVSSPRFATAYYEAVLRYRRRWFLFENKIPRCASLARSRPIATGSAGAAPRAASPTVPRRWRIGWFGYLDDERSWTILRCLAQRLPLHVGIYVRGMPYVDFDMNRFLADAERLDNVTYGGPYRNPEDLPEIYDAIDIVWSADCNAPTANSKWLLTNALYEAGYFGKPVMGLIDTAVGQFLTTHGTGWCLNEPIEEHLIEFIRTLTEQQYEATRNVIAALDSRIFVETDEIERIWTLLREKEACRRLPAYPASSGVSR